MSSERTFDNDVVSESDPMKKTESTNKPQQNPEFIPTAVVIKNIPFAVKKEQMIQYIDSLQLPMPYAFNYHFDNGVFRGLAFANFNNLKDTNLIIQHLNGKIMNGRKLRVEYKKIQQNADGTTNMSRTASNMSLSSMASSMSYMNNVNNNHQYNNNANANEDAQSNYSSSVVGNNTNQYANTAVDPASLVRYHAPMVQKETMLQSSQPPLDFNDPEVLEIYTQLILFKDRQLLYSEISWQQQYLTPQHKKIINSLCSFLNLYEISDPVYLSVRRQNQQPTVGSQNVNSPLQGYANMTNKQVPLSTGGSIYMQSNNGSVHGHQQHNLYQNSVHDDSGYLIKPPQGLFPSRNITPAAQNVGYMQQSNTPGSYMGNINIEKDPQVITTSQAGNYSNMNLTNPLLRSSQTGSNSLIRPQLSNVPSSNSFLLQQNQQQQLQPQTTSGSIQSVNSMHSINSSVTQGMIGLSLQNQQQQQQQRYKQHPLLQRQQHQGGSGYNQQDVKFSL